MNTNDDTASMLTEVRAANAELAKRAVAPLWYHPVLGILSGGMIAVLSRPIGVILIYNLVFVLACSALVATYRRRTGLWVTGYRKGRTRWVAIGMATAYVGVALGSIWLARERGLVWAPYAGGGVVAVVVTLCGFVWEAAFRRDLRDEGGL